MLSRNHQSIEFETKVELFDLPEKALGILREQRPDLKVDVESTVIDLHENNLSRMWRQIGRAFPFVGNTLLIVQERWSKLFDDSPSRIIIAADSTGKDKVLVVGGNISSALYAGEDCGKFIQAVVSEISDIDLSEVKNLGLID